MISFIKSFYTENIQLEVVIEVGVQQNGCAWTPLRISVVKGNFDAAYNSYMMTSVTGIIFRDCEGHILATCTYPNTFVVDATTAEARACLQKVVVVEDLGFRNLEVERDSCQFTGRSMNHAAHIMTEEGKR